MVVLGLLLIAILLVGLMQLSRVQTFVAQQMSSYLSKELNTNIQIGLVDIDFFNELILKEFLVEDQQDDSLIYLKSFC